jgi:hypothetical protein
MKTALQVGNVHLSRRSNGNIELRHDGETETVEIEQADRIEVALFLINDATVHQDCRDQIERLRPLADALDQEFETDARDDEAVMGGGAGSAPCPITFGMIRTLRQIVGAK